MPWSNRMGPRGVGPMTGRGLDRCAEPAMSPGMRMGGSGYGRGHRHMYYATGQPGWARAGYVPPTPMAVSADLELANLKAQAEWLTGQLDAIRRRIEDA